MRRQCPALGWRSPTSICASTDLPTPLRREMIVLNDLFNEHIGATDTPPLCRANSRYPLEPHRHRPTLAYTFAGSGTIGINEDGRQYTAPTGYIFAIDDEVLKHALAPSFWPRRLRREDLGKDRAAPFRHRARTPSSPSWIHRPRGHLSCRAPPWRAGR